MISTLFPGKSVLSQLFRAIKTVASIHQPAAGTQPPSSGRWLLNRGEYLKSPAMGIVWNIKANTPTFGLVKTSRPAKRSAPLLPIDIGIIGRGKPLNNFSDLI
ncbi:hypothetical protein ED312_14990 [Sinomicrobium pectinilyticum]|uniref:Uncharacterized protein n=1 Tax=Sinomicrobium pectinilyticum TaxID=1084421 RepID=A0A3N0E707_SINP1|nr:hypothetical protein ED312_14990 [Sinomicrobium pectinilyticum]